MHGSNWGKAHFLRDFDAILGMSMASHLPGRKVLSIQLGTSATAPAETLDISVAKRRVVDALQGESWKQ